MLLTGNKSTNQVLRSFLTAAKSGVKKASIAIDQMSASAVRMDVISAGIAPTSTLAEIAGSPEDMVVGVYIGVEGDIPGHALLVFACDSALPLIDMLIGQPVGTSTEIGDMERSVIQEIGNIVTSSYLNALSDFYSCCLMPTPPSVAVDMASAVVDSVLINTGHFDEDTVSIVTRFAGNDLSLRGFFLYIPEITTSL